MGLINVVRLNNTIYSWGSMIFRIDGQAKRGLVAADWEQVRERKLVHDNAPNQKPVGKTIGRYEVKSLSMKLLTDEWDALTTYLTTTGLGSYGDAEFTFMIQSNELGLAPLTVIGTGCNITSEKEATEEGIEENLTEIGITCMSLTRNGKRLWSVAKDITGLI
jgi:hypothetical protein